MNMYPITGATLSKIVWACSPYYTGALVYLIPFIMAVRGRRMRDVVVNQAMQRTPFGRR
jgi:hypothetical protein